MSAALRGAQKKKDLTAVEGHIVLAEYMEENPLLLSRPGMGVRLTTYYRKCSPLDASHQRLVQGTQILRAPTRALSAPRSTSTRCFGLGLGGQPASLSLL